VQDPEGTQRDILEVALAEFALNGLSGARIDEIAARTRASKRMIYS
jgi:AcrR family transcriptional regulator